MLSDLGSGLGCQLTPSPSGSPMLPWWADQDGRQPLLKSVCDNGLVEETHMVSLIQYHGR